MLGLIVRNALGPIKLGQPGFDFGQKYEPLNSIVDGGTWRHRLESLDNAVACKWLLHGLIVKHILASVELHVTTNTRPKPHLASAFSRDLLAGRKIVP